MEGEKPRQSANRLQIFVRIDHEGYPPGFLFEDLPEDFVCPACSVRYKEDFVREAE